MLDDLEAFRFEKNPFEGSRLCFGVSLGELGNGGSEVKSGECGCASADGDVTVDGSANFLFAACVAFGEIAPPSASKGDVIMLLITDVRFGIAKESEAGLGMLAVFGGSC